MDDRDQGAVPPGEALAAEARRCVELERRLARANADFEEFISRAAHNLREPLREVATYAQLVAESGACSLDPATSGYLDRIRAGAIEMQAVLGSVVDYSSIGVDSPQLARTDMDAVLNQALLSLARQIAERQAFVTHDSLPAVMGDFGVLSKVMRHLLGNAIEYCEEPVPRVHVSARLENAEWIISVQDNGPGIDPAFHARVFEPFRRLHGRAHPGHGLGLAWCKKAIEWQAGRIWLESASGPGAVFSFTLSPAG
jgi:light-regulated signal transduction histidine kinase (bacteriophytochrome)